MKIAKMVIVEYIEFLRKSLNVRSLSRIRIVKFMHLCSNSAGVSKSDFDQFLGSRMILSWERSPDSLLK